MAINGVKVLILEGSGKIGGGARTSELTLPGFKHDLCSAVHPTGFLSPFWRRLPLAEYGLKWIKPKASVAHPLEGEDAVLLTQSITETAENLGQDKKTWQSLLRPFLRNPEGLIKDILKPPLRMPKHPFLFASYGMKSLLPLDILAKYWLSGQRARALLAGNGAHSIMSLDTLFSSAIALMFSLMGHMVNWPVVAGGSESISRALAGYFKDLGGTIQTSYRIKNMNALPQAKAYLFDTDPVQLANIAGTALPNRYLQRLRKYDFGPGVFKLDWALSSSIPWSDPRCLMASTVHLGGTIEEIILSEKAAWQGRKNEKPFIIVCQQSEFDTGRAPKGKHTGYAYCHVPFDSSLDYTRIIEDQMERFAPGFKDIILARHSTSPRKLYLYNPNFYGGSIAGGAPDISQLFSRPVVKMNPYSTPNKKIFIGSAFSPPGGGAHGMCGYYAARTILKTLG